VFSFASAVYDESGYLSTAKGISIENAMNTLSTLVGSNYEISFIKYGINYKVIVQAFPVPCIARGYLETLCEK
jgi:HAE1 family hydrophobic/amphiphilic exporter-1